MLRWLKDSPSQARLHLKEMLRKTVDALSRSLRFILLSPGLMRKQKQGKTCILLNLAREQAIESKTRLHMARQKAKKTSM